MKEFGKTETEREIAKLKSRSPLKSPVKAYVASFEAKNRNDGAASPTRSKSPAMSSGARSSPVMRGRSASTNDDRANQMHSPVRSKSPGVNSQPRSSPIMRAKSPGVYDDHANQTYSPVRSKSPGMSSQPRSSPVMRAKSPGVYDDRANRTYSPVRSKSPGMSSQPRSSPGMQVKSPEVNQEQPNRMFSPTRSKSPGMSNERRNQVFSPTGSKSPALNERVNQGYNARSKSPSVNTNRPTQLFSPTQAQEIKTERVRESFTPSPGSTKRTKWTFKNQTWQKESPEISVSWETELNDERADDSSPQVGDSVDVSWIFDNLEFITTPEPEEINETSASQVNQRPENDRNTMKDDNRQEVFRNVLTYNIRVWENNKVSEGNTPKKADEFIQRMCDELRGDVEFLCGTNFDVYKAISYKTQIAGSTGIFYYIKVNVWQNYCLHLRIYSDEREHNSIPVLQAILERTQGDNGNIEFF